MTTEGPRGILIVKHQWVDPQMQKPNICNLQKQCGTITSTPKMGLICNKYMPIILDQHSTRSMWGLQACSYTELKMIGVYILYIYIYNEIIYSMNVFFGCNDTL